MIPRTSREVVDLYLETRRRHEQAPSLMGRYTREEVDAGRFKSASLEWPPSSTRPPDGSYEDLLGLVRGVTALQVVVFELERSSTGLYYVKVTHSKTYPTLEAWSKAFAAGLTTRDDLYTDDEPRARRPSWGEIGAVLGGLTGDDVRGIAREGYSTVEDNMMRRR